MVLRIARRYVACVSSGSNSSEYRYDVFGQLVRENYKWDGLSFTMIYTYDEGGNITSKVKHTYVAGDGRVGSAIEIINYGYEDPNWKDKLTSHNGRSISYDEIGNPISDGKWDYTWTQGRKLQKMTSGSTTLAFKYNDRGIRTEKTVNGTTTKYNVESGMLTSEQRGSQNPIYYLYDTDGSLWGVNYKDKVYFYVSNAQNDITAIVDRDGQIVVKYSYDAWGSVINVSGTLADTLGQDNPFRYREYYFDKETGFYLTGTRYYDPFVGRFISPDDTAVLSMGHENMVQYNLFSYCFNNPVNLEDQNGYWPNWVKAAIGVVATVGAVAITVATGGLAAPILIGVAMSTVSGAAISAVSHRITTGSWKGSGKAAIDGAADGLMWGGIGAFASSAVSAIKAVKTAKQGITIGEGMIKRVQPFAKSTRLATYKGLRGFKIIEKVVGKNIANKLGLAHNKAWIMRQVKLGARIFDIGQSGLKIASPFYAMERQIVNGYFRHLRLFFV